MTSPAIESEVGETFPIRLIFLFYCGLVMGCSNTAVISPVTAAAAEESGSKTSIEDAMPLGEVKVDDTNPFEETFERAVSMADTYFSEIHLVGSGRFEIDSLSDVPGAPRGDLLPVSDDGDRELRYYEGDGGIAGTHSMAVAPVTAGYVDSCFSGFLGATVTNDRFGSRTAGLMCRASGNGWAQDAYVAKVSFGSVKNDKVSFQLSLMKRGVIHADNVAARSGSFPLNYATENIYLELRCIGDQISASYWRVNGSGQKEFLTRLSIQDDTLRSGGNGIYAFSRGNKSVLFDDLRIESLPEAR